MVEWAPKALRARGKADWLPPHFKSDQLVRARSATLGLILCRVPA